MKKILLTTLMSISITGLVSAQDLPYRLMNMNHTNETTDDTQINEGDVVVFGTAEYEPAKLRFLTYNDSGETVYLRVECEGLTNTNGDHMELCYGSCYYGIDTFIGYPLENPIMVQPGQSQGTIYDYFSNTDGASDLVEYQFRFFQCDEDGFEIPDTSLHFTYRYDANMATSDVNSIAIAEVYPTAVKDFTTVSLKENAQVQILNLEGKSVKSLNLNSGETKLNLSDLAAGVYLIQFKGVSGTTTMKKIVVK